MQTNLTPIWLRKYDPGTVNEDVKALFDAGLHGTLEDVRRLLARDGWEPIDWFPDSFPAHLRW